MSDQGGGDRRVLKVEREIREVVAGYLLTGFRGQLHGLVSVSRVSASRDLRSARVYVSVLGAPGEAEASLESLQEQAFAVQAEINRRLQMKFCPKLKFFLDESMENVLRVEKILRDISEQNSSKTSESSGKTNAVDKTETDDESDT